MLVALAQAGYGVAVVPSNVRLPVSGLRILPLLQSGAAIGRWVNIAWDARRFLAPYAEHFVDELVTHARRGFPGRNLARRPPPLPRPPGVSP